MANGRWAHIDPGVPLLSPTPRKASGYEEDDDDESGKEAMETEGLEEEERSEEDEREQPPTRELRPGPRGPFSPNRVVDTHIGEDNTRTHINMGEDHSTVHTAPHQHIICAPNIQIFPPPSTINPNVLHCFALPYDPDKSKRLLQLEGRGWPRRRNGGS